MISARDLSLGNQANRVSSALWAILPFVALLSFGLLMIYVFLYQEWQATGSLVGVPLDDSWIHFRFAENLRSGDGLAFNPGKPTPGSTAPLWAVILGLVGAGYVIPAKTIGILAYLACGILVYMLSLKIGLDRFIAVFVGLGTLAAGRLIWAAPSGMETTLFTLLSLWAIWLWSRGTGFEIPVSVSITMGLGCLLRPEGYLLLTLTVFLWTARWIRHRQLDRLHNLIRHLVVSGLIVLPYIVFSHLTTGHLLPNTFYVKTSAWGCEPSLVYYGWISWVFFLDSPVMFFFAVIGILYGFRDQRRRSGRWFELSACWLIFLPVAYGFIAPCISGHFARYTVPLIPVSMLFAGVGANHFKQIFPGWMSKLRRTQLKPGFGINFIRMLLIEGILLALLPAFFYWAPFYAQSVRDIQEMEVKVALWLAENTDPQDVLAVNDIGAIGILADRNVLDLVGLVSPEVIPLVESKQPGDWDAGLASYLAQQRPQYLVVFPNWYPNMIPLLPAETVYAVSIPPRTVRGFPQLSITGGGELVVYRLDW